MVTGPRLSCLHSILFCFLFLFSSQQLLFYLQIKPNETVLSRTIIWPLISLLFSHFVKFHPQLSVQYLSSNRQTLHSACRPKYSTSHHWIIFDKWVPEFADKGQESLVVTDNYSMAPDFTGRHLPSTPFTYPLQF